MATASEKEKARKDQAMQEITDWLTQLNTSGPVFDEETVSRYGTQGVLTEQLKAHAVSLFRTLKEHLPVKYLPNEENRILVYITYILSYRLVDEERKNLDNFKYMDGIRNKVTQNLYLALTKGVERNPEEYAVLLKREVDRLKTLNMFDESNQVESNQDQSAQPCADRNSESNLESGDNP